MNDNVFEVVDEALTKNGFVYQGEDEYADTGDRIQFWRNRKGKKISIILSEVEE